MRAGSIDVFRSCLLLSHQRSASPRRLSKKLRAPLEGEHESRLLKKALAADRRP
jgi:hypothetical protein